MTEFPTRAPTRCSPSLANLRSLLAIRGIALLGQPGVLACVLYSSRTVAHLAASLALVTWGSISRLTWRFVRSTP